MFHKVLPLLLPNNLEEIVASLEEKYKAFLNAVFDTLYYSLFNFNIGYQHFDIFFRTKNLPSTKAKAAESNLWKLDSENEISSYVSKQLTASAKKGIAKAKSELTRASQNLISLATTASDVLDGEKHRTKHRRPRSKGGMGSI